MTRRARLPLVGNDADRTPKLIRLGSADPGCDPTHVKAPLRFPMWKRLGARSRHRSTQFAVIALVSMQIAYDVRPRWGASLDANRTGSPRAVDRPPTCGRTGHGAWRTRPSAACALRTWRRRSPEFPISAYQALIDSDGVPINRLNTQRNCLISLVSAPGLEPGTL